MLPTLALLSALAAAPTGTELWLVRALYPGQELLVGRTEDAIRELMPPELRAGEVIGRRELEQHLRGKAADLACLLGDARCAEPVGALLSSLGFSRVVLVKGGQDEAGYTFKVATFTPASAEVATAEGSGQSLGKALTGALVKVVPLAATLEVVTDPPGMTVLVDGERVGQTPLSTQVLPGERAVRIEGPFYVPQEIKQTFAVRGRATLRPVLEKTPARLTISVQPPEAQIFVDGQAAGTGKVDRGISAGPHTVRLALGDYEPQEVKVQAGPGETVTVNRTLVQGGLAALHQEAYARAWDVVVLGDLVGVGAGRATFYGPNQGDLTATSFRGFQGEVGSYDNFVGFSLLGLQVAQASGLSDFLPTGASAIPLRFTRYGVSAFQPRFRVHFWRLQAFAQAGLDFQVFVGQPEDNSNTLKLYSLGLAGRAGLRVFPFKGLFLEVAYGARMHLPVVGEVPFQQGLLGGVGYGF